MRLEEDDFSFKEISFSRMNEPNVGGGWFLIRVELITFLTPSVRIFNRVRAVKAIEGQLLFPNHYYLFPTITFLKVFHNFLFFLT